MTTENKNRGKTKRNLIIGIILVAAAIILILFFVRNYRTNADDSYKSETIEKRNIVNYYSYSGVIESRNRQNVIARELMQISEILVSKGDKVVKDDVLLKTNYNTEIVSDIDGEIGNIYVEENAQVAGGTQLIDIVDYDNLKVSIKIDEYDIGSISLEQEMDVEIGSIEKNIKGTVSDISREAVNMNGVSYFTAEINLEFDEDIRVGMNAEAKTVNENAEAVNSISMEALQFNTNNEPYVMVKDEQGNPVERSIEVGINDGLYIEVKSGLTETDTILIPQIIVDTNSFRPPFARGDM